MRILMSLLVLVSAVSLAACNTIRGIGQDIEKAGESIQKAGSK